MALTFGYGLISCERHPAVPGRTAVELYQEALRLAEAAERLGLDTVWTTEHHFVDSDYLPAPLTMAAAMTAVTRRIRVGTGVALAPLYQPVRLAEEAATIDLLGEGRFVLGLGLGWSKVEFAAFGAERARRGRALEEIFDILRQAAADDVVHHHGPIYDVPEVSIRPKPARGRLAIWVGAEAEPALRRAARLADGVFVMQAPLDEFRADVAIVRDELERSGRDPATLALATYLTVLPQEGQRDAWDEFGELVLHTQWKYLDMGRSARRTGQPMPPRGELPDGVADRLRATTVAGSPEACADRIAAYREAAGGDLHVMARNYLPGLSAAGQADLLERFARTVVPLLR